MRAKPRGATGAPKRHLSFIRLRPDPSATIPKSMGTSATGGQHLTDAMLDRAQEIAKRLLDLFPPERGSMTRLENASKAAGIRLKQQTVSALLRNRQCGYVFATQLMAYAKKRPELASYSSNYIIGGHDGGLDGTVGAATYANRPMRYRAKGEYLDTLVGSLPAEFLDFTASRDPAEPNADAWQQTEWFAHVSRELEFWKYMKAQKKTR